MRNPALILGAAFLVTALLAATAPPLDAQPWKGESRKIEPAPAPTAGPRATPETREPTAPRPRDKARKKVDLGKTPAPYTACSGGFQASPVSHGPDGAPYYHCRRKIEIEHGGCNGEAWGRHDLQIIDGRARYRCVAGPG